MIPEWQKDCSYFEEKPFTHSWNNKCRVLSIDTETSGVELSTNHLVGISISDSTGVAGYLPVAHKNYDNVPVQEAIQFLNNLVERRVCVFYNAEFDLGFLEREGFKRPPYPNYLDVRILLYHIHLDLYQKKNPKNILSLKKASKQLLGLDMIQLHEVLGISKVKFNKKYHDKHFGHLPVDGNTLAYACADADCTLRLYNYAVENGALDPKYDFIRELDHRLARVVTKLEDTGQIVNPNRLASLKVSLEDQRVFYEKEVLEARGKPINLNSSKQIREWLYEEMKLPVCGYTKANQPAADKKTLIKLHRRTRGKYKFLESLLQYKKCKHYLSQFVEGIEKEMVEQDGVYTIHPSYHVASLVTGRLSSSDED